MKKLNIHIIIWDYWHRNDLLTHLTFILANDRFRLDVVKVVMYLYVNTHSGRVKTTRKWGFRLKTQILFK